MNKILVIEDTRSVLNAVKMILRLENYEVLEAQNGEEGIEIAAKHLPDLIICDIMMPLVDGYDVLETLKHEKSTATIPFIFLTAKAAKEELRKGMVLGADDYITKPFTSEETVQAVKFRIDKYKIIKRNEILMDKTFSSKREFFKGSLKVHGLDIIVNMESQYNELLDVLHKIINYPVHEKEKPFLGVLFKKEITQFSSAKIKIFNKEDLELAFKLSGSNQSFVLYNENEFKGLIIFEQELVDEKIILEVLENTESVLISSSKGINKVYFNGNVFTNHRVNWEHKYPLIFYITQISKSLPVINDTIINLMNFVYYNLSPNHIGTTIVYCFENILIENDFLSRKINTIKRDLINVNNKTDIIALKNIICKTDGAVFIDREGNFIDDSIHLNSSEESKKVISLNLTKGTRHNSAQRYSFDNKDCLVITVSEDGHVTFYLNGLDI